MARPHRPSTLPAPSARGLLAEKPLAQLLAYGLDQRISGTFELEAPDGERTSVVLENGCVARVATTEAVAYLGPLLYEEGVVDQGGLNASLAVVAKTKRLHGEVLLEAKLLTVAQLAAGLHRQRLRKLHHAFGLPPMTTFSFYADVDLVGARRNDPEPFSPLASIWRGISLHPSWPHVGATAALVGARRLRVAADLEDAGLGPAERAAAETLRLSPLGMAEFAETSGLAGRAGELLAYFLVICKLARLEERPRATPAPLPSPPASTRPDGPPSMSFTAPSARPAKVSVRTPSPFPSMRTPTPPPASAERPVAPPPVSTRTPPPGHPSAPPASVRSSAPTPPPPRASTAPARANPAADHALSQADMHLVLGEHAQALAAVRQALVHAPDLPAATVLLVYLEAMTATKGEERYLRDLLRMADAALARQPSCRRGYFYRAHVKRLIGDAHGALADLKLALENDPSDAEVVKELRAQERIVAEGKKPSGFLKRLQGG
jgi:hypothetical protein